MDYYFYKSKISITNINIDEYITILPTGNYYIEFHYELRSPNEILFWIPYEEEIEINFLGISDISRINNSNNSYNL